MNATRIPQFLLTSRFITGDLMKIEYLIILALLIVIIVIIIISQNLKKRLREQLTQQKTADDAFKTQTQKDYLALEAKFKKELEECKALSEKEFEAYQNEVKKNFQEKIPYGEQQLLKTFKKLLSANAFHDFTIYVHLAYENDYGFREVDFFIVSPKGLFVIESKRWNGITYIYDESYPDIFKGTMFDKFAVGSNKGVRVFNAQWSEDKKDEIVLSGYNHPLSQARGYSFDLKQTFGTPVSNIVVFGNSLKSAVLFNGEPLHQTKVDNYTDIIVEQKLEKFFNARQNCLSREDIDAANQKIQALLKWQFKIDKNNCHEGPFNLVDLVAD